jgi:hypothetical protein
MWCEKICSVFLTPSEGFCLCCFEHCSIFLFQHLLGQIQHHTVNVEVSFYLLHYLRDCKHPDYVDLVLPDIQDFGTELQGLSNQALDDTIISDGRNTGLVEERMQNSESGHSALITATGGAATNSDALAGIAAMVHEADADNDKPADAEATSPPAVQMEINRTPMNEFEEHHRIVRGTFPFEFPLGVPETFKSGHFPEKVLRRLLKAYVVSSVVYLFSVLFFWGGIGFFCTRCCTLS